MPLILVAPLVGAWIEMYTWIPGPHGQNVAPLVGAWIEIDYVLKSLLLSRSRSPRGSVD